MSFSASTQVSVHQAITERLGAFCAAESCPYSPLIVNRLCSSQACIALHSAPKKFIEDQLVSFKASQPKQTKNVYLILQLCQSICEELLEASNNFSFSMKEQVETDLRSIMPMMLEFLSHVLTTIESSTESSKVEITTKIFQCVLPWILMGGISISTIVSQHFRLFEATLRIFKQSGSVDYPHQPLLLATTLVLESLLGHRSYPKGSSHETGIRLIIQTCLEMKDRYGLIVETEAGEDTCHALISIASNLAEREVEWLVLVSKNDDDESNYQRQAFLQLLLQYTCHPKRQLAMMLLEFWMEVAEFPIAERHPWCCHSLFQQLGLCLIQQCTYPREFTATAATASWDQYYTRASSSSFLVEEDDFNAFRLSSESCQDNLVVIYYLLRQEYLQMIMANIQHHTDESYWQGVEANLFALSCIMKEVTTEHIKKQHSNQNVAFVHSILSQIQVHANTVYSCHPFIIKTCCELIGSSSEFLNESNTPPSILPSLLSFLQSALLSNCPHSREAAAVGLKKLSMNCGLKIYHECPELVYHRLIPLMEQALTCEMLTPASRMRIIEGITCGTLSSIMNIQCEGHPINQDQQQKQVLSLLQPFVHPAIERLVGVVSNPGSNATRTQNQTLASDFKAVSTMIRCLESQMTIAFQVFQMIWQPMHTGSSSNMLWSLDSAPQDGDSEMVTGLLTFYAQSIETLASAFDRSIIFQLATEILEMYRKTWNIMVFESLGHIVQACTASSPKQDVEGFILQLLDEFSASSFHYLERISAPGAATDVIEVYFQFLHRSFSSTDSVALLFQMKEFPKLIQLACHCIGSPHRESTRACLTCLSHLILHSSLELHQMFHEMMVSNAQSIFQTIFNSLISSCPTTLYVPLADFCYTFLLFYHDEPSFSARVLASFSTTLAEIIDQDIPTLREHQQELQQYFLT